MEHHMSTATLTIFQSSDLNQRGRAVLDAAREGFVRVRDKDGASLVMTREERFDELERRNAVGDGIAHAAASFMLLEQAVEHRSDAHTAPGLAEFGDWVWVRHLPASDLHEFVVEMRDALYQACREFSLEPIQESLDAWRETAMALRDPLSRETLLGEQGDDDYVEAQRPEDRVAV
jgi:hypothetical protein